MWLFESSLMMLAHPWCFWLWYLEDLRKWLEGLVVFHISQHHRTLGQQLPRGSKRKSALATGIITVHLLSHFDSALVPLSFSLFFLNATAGQHDNLICADQKKKKKIVDDLISIFKICIWAKVGGWYFRVFRQRVLTKSKHWTFKANQI